MATSLEAHTSTYIQKHDASAAATNFTTATASHPVRGSYHDYIGLLCRAGWDNLKELDTYMSQDIASEDLVISTIDIMANRSTRRWPDIHNDIELKRQLYENTRDDTQVRLYLVEQRGLLAPGIIEAFGSSLCLDPRFFMSALRKGENTRLEHVLSPSQQYRLPFLSIPFSIPKKLVRDLKNSEFFGMFMHVQRNATGDGWTGVLLFDSHSKFTLSPRSLIIPPPFKSNIPPVPPHGPRTCREFYLETFPFLDLDLSIKSPFYAIQYLLRLNYICWNMIVTSAAFDLTKPGYTSDPMLWVSESLKKILIIMQKGGRLGWVEEVGGQKLAMEIMKDLEEDFQHLVNLTDSVWRNGDRMATIREQKEKARQKARRTTHLSAYFTYLLVPVTIISSLYGNVSQIGDNGRNPGIWQFLVAVTVLNIAMVLVVVIFDLVHKRYRKRFLHYRYRLLQFLHLK
ncbi:hypothetical protein NA56DRAFT_613792 [Hyaloscypha hepaticicola]|uniref:Cora-domain-containing protein n=1 Tax=Hyaloscypha hepaticicola TaxID=2082293 RepID=A0A2J6PDS9_9HELO|nr:hypothetical protein NA56DRAFT_613792 [Hyaloscypha hepaticicola]